MKKPRMAQFLWASVGLLRLIATVAARIIPVASRITLITFFFTLYTLILISPFFIERYVSYLVAIRNHPSIAICLFVALGFGLFQLRTHYLAGFALIEITGGIALAWNTVQSTYSSGVVFWTAFMSATYLLVRGFDNGWKGIKEFPKQITELEFGYSTISFQDAVKNTIVMIVDTDITNYETEKSLSFKEATYYEISKAAIYLDSPVVYEVALKITRRMVQKTAGTDRKYSDLREGRLPLFSAIEHFPLILWKRQNVHTSHRHLQS